jgi:hypothetical protein
MKSLGDTEDPENDPAKLQEAKKPVEKQQEVLI